MLRITITDTKTNETIFETFAKCICAGIAVNEDTARSIFFQHKDGISRMDAVHCLDAVDSAKKRLIKMAEVRAAIWIAKLFSKKEEEVVK